MSNPNLGSQESKSTLSRRLLLKGSALLCGVHFSGASSLAVFGQEPFTPAEQSTADGKDGKVEPFLDEGYRLFLIEPEDRVAFVRHIYARIPASRFILYPEIMQNPVGRKPLQNQGEKQRAKIGAAREPNKRAAPVAEKGQALRAPAEPHVPPAVLYLVWTNQETADQVAKMQGVKSVTEKKPTDVLESGSADDAGGVLSVKLLPSKGNLKPSNDPYATVEQVVNEFRQALKIVGNDTITFSVVAATGEPHLPKGGDMEEQIKIEFSSPKLDEDVLEMIKSHPQVMEMKWGGEYSIAGGCPGCGLG